MTYDKNRGRLEFFFAEPDGTLESLGAATDEWQKALATGRFSPIILFKPRTTSHGRVVPEGWVDWGKGKGRGGERGRGPPRHVNSTEPAKLTLLGRCKQEFSAEGWGPASVDPLIAELLASSVHIHSGQEVDLSSEVGSSGIATVKRMIVSSHRSSVEYRLSAENRNLFAFAPGRHRRHLLGRRFPGILGEQLGAEVFDDIHGRFYNYDHNAFRNLRPCIRPCPAILDRSEEVLIGSSAVALHPRQHIGFSFLQLSAWDDIGIAVKVLGHWCRRDNFFIGVSDIFLDLEQAGKRNLSESGYFYSPRTGTMLGPDGTNFTWGCDASEVLIRRLAEEGSPEAESWRKGKGKGYCLEEFRHLRAGSAFGFRLSGDRRFEVFVAEGKGWVNLGPVRWKQGLELPPKEWRATIAFKPRESPSATPALQSGKGSGRRCGGGRGYKGGKGRHLRPEQALDLPALEILADKPLANWGPAASYVDSDIVNVEGLTYYAASVLEAFLDPFENVELSNSVRKLLRKGVPPREIVV
ncbi:unnamed protein product [Polarella glacialis]|uniref:Uncharacterized protein n=1 Tax=Polarella glacialis TaxID=89957 RepID=A0A813DJC0_POLGL|nr:unnamed protein product [Polarella glacialis]